MALAVAVLTGIALAACAGLRAFLPLFAAGLAARFFEWPLSGGMSWLASDPALVSFGVATLVEIVADKVPVLDHALDGAQTFLAPAAGALVAVSALTDLPPSAALVLGVLTGAPVAGGVHLLAATTRVKSSVLTGTVANPFLSVLEDVGALAGVAVAFVLPLVAALLVVLVGGLLFRLRRRGRPAPAGGAELRAPSGPP